MKLEFKLYHLLDHLGIDKEKYLIERIDELLAQCPEGECITCSEIVCPFKEPLHFHHDGCPACCTMDDQLAYTDEQVDALNEAAAGFDSDVEALSILHGYIGINTFKTVRYIYPIVPTDTFNERQWEAIGYLIFEWDYAWTSQRPKESE